MKHRTNTLCLTTITIFAAPWNFNKDSIWLNSSNLQHVKQANSIMATGTLALS